MLLANPFSQSPLYETVYPKSEIKNIQIEYTLQSFTSAYIPTTIAIPKPMAKRTHATQLRERSQEEKRVCVREREREREKRRF